MKILIENYRGFDIDFDTDCEKFQCVITEEKTKESISFSAVKKFIDDYKKENQDFKPFYADKNPKAYSGHPKIKIIGIRKDKRFIIEREDGGREQLSEYEEDNYMIFKPENEEKINALKKHRQMVEALRVKNNEIDKGIIASLNIITLKEFKKTII